MRTIKHIVLHCTATQPSARVAAIQRYWREVLRWRRPGYHYIISASGKVDQLSNEAEPANGVRGLNEQSLHISYIGGIDASGRPSDTRTAAQRKATKTLIKELLGRYPEAKLAGHYHFANKACPSFDVPAWLEAIGVPEANIYRNGKTAPVASM